MFRHGRISTETDRKPFIFTVTAAAACGTGAVLLFVFGKGDALSIFAGVLLSIVFLAAAAVLFAMVTDCAWIGDGELHMGYLFRNKTVKLKEIGKICYKDDVYTVFGRDGQEIGSINAKLTGIGRVLHELDRQGVRFE
ncbi:MAG: hypothetical protein IJM76_09805 [Lachnospiraceae bacterium]|nr:hypothetical protein [Lachnospiraceae bacterium]